MSEEPHQTPATPEPEAIAGGAGPSNDERTMAMLTHLLAFTGYFTFFGMVVGPLILWLVKKDTMPFVDDQGKEAVNFNISFMIYYVISFVLMFVLIGFFIAFVLGLLHIIFVIVAAVKASNGEAYRYPMTIRLVK